ncbi:MAG TPA: ABA4-like family protein [Kofleriaceae bacterium]|nr:ABA4-like family protein [Kofleriaceae bacterium]
MSPDRVFLICTYAVLPAWGLLVLAPRWAWTDRLINRVWIPVLLGLVYVWAALAGPTVPEGAGFGSLAAVIILFSSPFMMLAGWIHFLAFDLFIGAWQVRDARRHGVAHLFVIPCLVLTLLFGPTGLLLYFAVRYATSRTVAVTET